MAARNPRTEVLSRATEVIECRLRETEPTLLGETRQLRNVDQYVMALLRRVRWTRIEQKRLRAILALVIGACDWRDLDGIDRVARAAELARFKPGLRRLARERAKAPHRIEVTDLSRAAVPLN